MTDPADSRAFPELRLQRGEERRVEGGHPWIFSNEIDTGCTPLTAFAPGMQARLMNAQGRFVAYVYVNPRTLICARVLSRDPARPPSRALFAERIRAALALRERLYPRPFYRLVFGESDGLPGLVLDRYDDVIVGQSGTAGMDALLDDIVAATREALPLSQFIWKNDSGAREIEGLSASVWADRGDVPESLHTEENGVRFRVPIAEGQKTGWFFDQAPNRAALLKYVPGKRVLDVFSYVGAWGLAASRAGASEVLCVDTSAAALQVVESTAVEQGLAARTLKADAFDALEKLHAAGERFDVVILDPPAFIKRKKQTPKGEAAYRRLYQLGLQLLPPDGIMVACSCSQHLAADHLFAIIQKAACNTRRFVQVLETGGQGPDHPIHPAIPETQYLKSYFCRALAE